MDPIIADAFRAQGLCNRNCSSLRILHPFLCKGEFSRSYYKALCAAIETTGVGGLGGAPPPSVP